MEVLEPHQGVVAEELADLAAAVIGAAVPPRRLAAPVVVEVDPAQSVLRPAVELPDVEVAGAEVVVNHVEDDGDAEAVGRLDELLEGPGTAVSAFDREDVRGLYPQEKSPANSAAGMISIALTPISLR